MPEPVPAPGHVGVRFAATPDTITGATLASGDP